MMLNQSELHLIPHGNSYQPGYVESLRSLFYLLWPSKSSFENISYVPDYTSAASPAFFTLIALEFIVSLCSGSRTLRVNDSITSLNAGIMSRLIKLVGNRSIELVMYIHVYDNWRLVDLSWDSSFTWFLSFLGMDFAYYWFHRAAHEINVFWISHQTHHSSEDYNLTTALRQSSLQGFVSMFIYLPNALLIPPSIHLVHSQVNILFQFWIHTELIDNLGPLEYILNTPSHHRVHHGRNPYCIDKNYAGVLIIWDRMFGTFAAERKDEEIAYGLVHSLNSFDPVYVQFGSLQALFTRFWKYDTIQDKIFSLVNGPGWTPGKSRCGDINDIPQIEIPIKKYDPNNSKWLAVYAVLHYLNLLPLFTKLMVLRHTMPGQMILCDVSLLILSASCMGFLFDKKPFAYLVECIRCIVLSIGHHWFKVTFEMSHGLPATLLHFQEAFFFLSAVIWLKVLFSERVKRKVD